MYYKTLVFFTFIWIGFSACNSAKTVSGEVNFISSPESGSILVNSGGYGPTKPLAIKNAESNAFNTLIFKGIPGSQQQLPMLPDERDARAKHSTYFEELLNGGYKPFMMASDATSAYAAGRHRRKNINQRVKINVDALRRDMEQHGIVRKFGL